LVAREVYQTVGSKARRRLGLPGTSKRRLQSPRSTKEESVAPDDFEGMERGVRSP
jgi:hypothetical protein